MTLSTSCTSKPNRALKSKFTRRALNADANVKLVSLVRTAENKFYRLGIESPDELVDGFPRDPSELYGYEMIVIGSVGAEDLDPVQQRALMSFVRERGGGVLFWRPASARARATARNRNHLDATGAS